MTLLSSKLPSLPPKLLFPAAPNPNCGVGENFWLDSPKLLQHNDPRLLLLALVSGVNFLPISTGLKKLTKNGFKATKYFGHGNPVCGTLYTVSACCKTTSGIVVWIPFPGKICILSGLKSISTGCKRICDLCAGDPTNPLC